MGISGQDLGLKKGVKPPFELRGGTCDSSRVTAGESGLNLYWGGAVKLGVTLEL